MKRIQQLHFIIMLTAPHQRDLASAVAVVKILPRLNSSFLNLILMFGQGFSFASKFRDLKLSRYM